MNLCESLDGYLEDRLDEAGRSVFESHLAECRACAEEVRLARKIDALLAKAPTAAPPSLATNIATVLQARRRRRRATGAALAAGLLLGALGVWQAWPPDASRPTASDRPTGTKPEEPSFAAHPSAPLEQPSRDDPTVPSTPPAAPVTVQTGPGAIALEHPSDDPTVHVFWIYPATSVSAQAPENPPSSDEPERNAL